MIYAGNDITVDTKGEKYQLDVGDSASKLTMFVFGNRVFLQVSEDYPPTYDASSTQEMVLEKGFHSREFLIPITGFKIRSEMNTSTIHFVAYG